MRTAVFWIMFAYFLAGALGFMLVNRKSDPTARGERWKKYLSYIVIVNAIVFGIIHGPALQVIALVLWATGLYEIISIWRRNTQRSSSVLGLTLLLFFAAGIAFLMYSRLDNEPEKMMVYVLIVTFDGFSQITGQLFGKRKLVPRISPNKTSEGLAGGVLTALATAFLLRPWLETGLAQTLFTALFISGAGLTGDLLASRFKRLNGVKDYSRLIPGHGGVLDRFDSYIVAGGCYWILTVLR